MSWVLAEKQLITSGRSSSFSGTFTGAVNSGDLVVAAVTCYAYGGGSEGTITVTDSKSNSYPPAAQSAIEGGNHWAAINASIVAAPAAAGALAVTSSFSIQQAGCLSLLRYTNAAGTISADAGASATSAGTPGTSAGVTFSAAASGELAVIALATKGAGETYTPPSGYTQQLYQAFNTYEPTGIFDNTSIASGSHTPTAGLSASSIWAMAAATFKVTASGVPAPVPIQILNINMIGR